MITSDKTGKEKCQIKEFGTFTHELMTLRDWLVENHIPIVAIESTGVYWRPVHNVLEGYVQVVLANARHIKNVPGRKTDISDSKWLAGLLRHGLIRGSFIPPKHVRHWRELTQLRRSYTYSLADYKRRVHKLFEMANIKIDSIVTDLFGVTGRSLIKLLCQNNPDLCFKNIQTCAKGSLKSKTTELYQSVQGFFENHHRFQLKLLMKTIHLLEKQINAISKRLSNLMKPHRKLLQRIDEVHGIDQVAAQSVISYIGITLDEFATEKHLASWAGLCPGNHQSANKRKNAKNAVQNHPLKTLLVEIAWAAIRKKGSYYKDKYYRLKARRGAKRAIVAIAHRILKAVFHIVKYGKSFKDLGENYLTQRNRQLKYYQLKKQAQMLGFKLLPAN
jgi:transposase